MKKTLTILSYSSITLNMYYKQIKSLFSDYLKVETICMNSIESNEEIISDIILVPSFAAFLKINSQIKRNSEIIFANRTISKLGLDKIMRIPSGSDVIILDESLEMSKQIISVLYQIGIKHINLIPAYPGYAKDMNDKTVIVLGHSSYIPSFAKEIINIGSSFLDISTIIEVGTRLELDHVLNRQNIRNSYKEIVTANSGLAQILGKVNRFESQLDILMQVIDDGVIGINLKGIIFSCNDNAQWIIGSHNEKIIGRNGITLLPQIPFEDVLESRRSVKEKLVRINEYDVVVSVDPITHSGKIHGAVAIVKKFSEEEKKQHRLRAKLIGKGHKTKYNFYDIVGKNKSIKKCIDIAKRMSKSNSSILITGESGTGKELFAQAMHNNSNRKDFQFVAINCGALPETLLESELFGYEEGAFTGARKGGKPGLFELAHRGTLFLDEIGEMPKSLQMRLLRVLQERQVMRIGGDRLINIDIRLIAATNRNLKKMVNEGEFREDLYYRLNVLPLKIPPLRVRTEDILPLINQFKKEFNGHFRLSEETKEVLLNHNWRGNVRELKNYVEYLVNLGINYVEIKDLPFDFEENLEHTGTISDRELGVSSFIENWGRNLEKYILVLEELEKGFVDNRRLGRRSIHEQIKKKDVFTSEQEIRSILRNLEKNNMVNIFRGRSGTVITGYGIKILKLLKKS